MQPRSNPSPSEILKSDKIELEEAIRLFDSLPSASLTEILGRWRGKGLHTGHPLDGLLERFSWFGKDFKSPENVHPLLFQRDDDSIYAVNPGVVPIQTLIRLSQMFKNKFFEKVVPKLNQLAETDEPKARLRMMAYRGVVTATMIYDQLPIHDHFRRIDENTLLGLMDLRYTKKPFFFTLTRVDESDALH